MAFTLRIATDNAAFTDNGTGMEVARILRKLADDIDYDGTMAYEIASGPASGNLYDLNGNRVGSWEITEREGY